MNFPILQTLDITARSCLPTPGADTVLVFAPNGRSAYILKGALTIFEKSRGGTLHVVSRKPKPFEKRYANLPGADRGYPFDITLELNWRVIHADKVIQEGIQDVYADLDEHFRGVLRTLTTQVSLLEMDTLHETIRVALEADKTTAYAFTNVTIRVEVPEAVGEILKVYDSPQPVEFYFPSVPSAVSGDSFDVSIEGDARVTPSGRLELFRDGVRDLQKHLTPFVRMKVEQVCAGQPLSAAEVVRVKITHGINHLTGMHCTLQLRSPVKVDIPPAADELIRSLDTGDAVEVLFQKVRSRSDADIERFDTITVRVFGRIVDRSFPMSGGISGLRDYLRRRIEKTCRETARNYDAIEISSLETEIDYGVEECLSNDSRFAVDRVSTHAESTPNSVLRGDIIAEDNIAKLREDLRYGRLLQRRDNLEKILPPEFKYLAPFLASRDNLDLADYETLRALVANDVLISLNQIMVARNNGQIDSSEMERRVGSLLPGASQIEGTIYDTPKRIAGGDDELSSDFIDGEFLETEPPDGETVAGKTEFD